MENKQDILDQIEQLKEFIKVYESEILKRKEFEKNMKPSLHGKMLSVKISGEIQYYYTAISDCNNEIKSLQELINLEE